MKSKNNLPELKVVYNNGSSVIIAKSAEGERKFPVVLYTDKDFEKIDKALAQLDSIDKK